MPKTSKYRAAGRSLGGYKKSLYDLQSKEYEIDYGKFELDRKVKLYEGVGTAAANILGIVREGQLLKEQNKYVDRAKGMTGIEAKTTQEDTWYGGKRDVTKYFSVDSGAELSIADLSAIGRLNAYGIETSYGDWVPPSEPELITETEPVDN